MHIYISHIKTRPTFQQPNLDNLLKWLLKQDPISIVVLIIVGAEANSEENWKTTKDSFAEEIKWKFGGLWEPPPQQGNH